MAKNKIENNAPEGRNIIVEGTTIEGNMVSNGNVRVDGKFIGTINVKGRLIIGPTGFVDGKIICQNADIEGTFDGGITVSELLSLKASSKLSGDISTGKLAIEPGSSFSGNCNMGGVLKDIKKNEEKREKALQAQTA